MPRVAAPALLALLGAACVAEPSRLCDRERLVWSLEEFEVGPEHDVSDRPGVQIDVLLRTSLEPGVLLTLTVLSEDGPLEGGRERVRGDGSALFAEVTVPPGPVTLAVAGHNGCREVVSTRGLFVFDDLGRPTCALSLAQRAVERAAYAPIPVLNAAADGDPDRPGFQADFVVSAGRPDVAVRLLVLDVGSGEETGYGPASDEGGRVEFPVVLGEGVQAVRAICEWTMSGFPQSTAVHTFFVDTIAPSCELIEPAGAVVPALEESYAVRLRGRAIGDDVFGEPGEFAINGTPLAGSPVDEAGESEAEAEIPHPPPPVQAYSFAATDHAGNRCEATAVFAD